MKKFLNIAGIALMCLALAGCDALKGEINIDEIRPSIDSGHRDNFSAVQVNQSTQSSESTSTSKDETVQSSSEQIESEPAVEVSIDLTDISNYTKKLDIDYDIDAESVGFKGDVDEKILVRVHNYGGLRHIYVEAIQKMCESEGIDIRNLSLYEGEGSTEYDNKYEYDIICMQDRKSIIALAINIGARDTRYLVISKGE